MCLRPSCIHTRFIQDPFIALVTPPPNHPADRPRNRTRTHTTHTRIHTNKYTHVHAQNSGACVCFLDHPTGCSLDSQHTAFISTPSIPHCDADIGRIPLGTVLLVVSSCAFRSLCTQYHNLNPPKNPSPYLPPNQPPRPIATPPQRDTEGHRSNSGLSREITPTPTTFKREEAAVCDSVCVRFHHLIMGLDEKA